MAREHPPIAVCPECGSYIPVGGRAELINERCANKNCRSSYTTAMNPSDWKLCNACCGDGFAADKKCLVCNGAGFVYQRDRLGGLISY
jgi:DnaJ-class molecular chaperone